MPETIRLTIGVPTAGMVRMGFAQSLVGLIAKLAAQAIPTRPEASLDCRMDTVESSVIHTNREQIVRRAIDAGRTHLLFLDDDMVFEPQAIDLLFSRRQPVVAVNYAIKREPIEFVAVGLSGNRIVTKESSTGLVPIAYTGFGVSLFDLDVFKKTPQPWFQPEFDPATSSYTTEDNPCYRRIREAGFPVYLDQDASKLVTHVGHRAFSWRDWKPPEVMKTAWETHSSIENPCPSLVPPPVVSSSPSESVNGRDHHVDRLLDASHPHR